MNDAINAADILATCLLEAGDDVEAGLLAAEYILSSDELPLSYDDPTPIPPLATQAPKVTPASESTIWTKDTYPRDHSGRFVDKCSIVDAANDDQAHTALRESIPEDQQWKLDRAIATLQTGGTVHHPSEPPGMAVDLSGGVANPDWAIYTYLLTRYEEWGDRHETRKHCRGCLHLATRNLRSKTTQNLDHVDDLLSQADIEDRERRTLSRARHRHGRSRITQDQLEDTYELVIERMLRKIEDVEEKDCEMEEPKAPGDPSHQISPASLAFGDALPAPSGHPSVMRRYGAKPGPGWQAAGVSRYGTPIWVWGPPQKKSGEPAPIGTEPHPLAGAPAAPPPPVVTGPPESPAPVSQTPPPIELPPPPPAEHATARRGELQLDESSTVRSPPGPSPEDTPHAQVARDMATEPFLTQEKIDAGANGTYRVKIGAIDAVWKPSSEEDVLRYGVKQGSYYRREAAAYSIARTIGIAHLVPVTVERKQGNDVGSVQQWIPDAKDAYKVDDSRTYDGEDDHKLAAAFDYLVGNTDRHMGNWMINADDNIGLIDHGLAFPQNDMDRFKSYLFNEAIKRSFEVPDAVNSWDERMITDELRAHNIEDSAIESVLDRLVNLKTAASFGGKFTEIETPDKTSEMHKKVEMAKIGTV